MSTGATVALDIGGTDVKYAVWGPDERFGVFPVGEGEDERLPDRLCAFLAKTGAVRIGISVPGPFDYDRGISFMVHKLPSLLGVPLGEQIVNSLPGASVLFLHDVVAFSIGAMTQTPSLAGMNFACVTLGTGLGYLNVREGRAEVNPEQTPRHPLWNMPVDDRIAEDLVSGKAIFTAAKRKGYSSGSVREIAEKARNGNKALAEIFARAGRDLGTLLNEKQKQDGFSRIVLGGQISRSWDLFLPGFREVCPILYSIAEDPVVTALTGVRACQKNGKERYLSVAP